ncbi:MAG TPA: hypothetical protein VK963_03920, partial [Candidatus Saccharimonadales bacterium]|nr:hypothetical protein [Candidatus Saccharimonadales bacterium]
GGRHKKVIAPLGDIEVNKSILDKIASDPNIINRSSEDAAKAKIVTAAVTPQPDQAPAATAPRPAANNQPLRDGQFRLYQAGPGCDTCGKAGYQGRLGVYEVLEIDETLSKLIVSHATSEEIQVAAIRAGMLTMQQDGFLKALGGLTTVEEILRVTRE